MYVCTCVQTPEYALLVTKAQLQLNTAMRPLAQTGPSDQTPEAFNALLPLFFQCTALIQVGLSSMCVYVCLLMA